MAPAQLSTGIAADRKLRNMIDALEEAMLIIDADYVESPQLTEFLSAELKEIREYLRDLRNTTREC